MEQGDKSVKTQERVKAIPKAGEVDRGFSQNPSVIDLLRKGRAFQKAGDYLSAVASFERAVYDSPDSEEALFLAFSTFRQIAISRFLIEKYVNDLGLSREEYRGFDRIEPQLMKEFVLRRLNELLEIAPRDSRVAFKMYASLMNDEFAKTGLVREDLSHPIFKSPQDSAHLMFLLARSAVANAKPDQAVDYLLSLLAQYPLYGLARLLLCKIDYREGRAHEALSGMNLVFENLNDSSFDIGKETTETSSLGEYKSHYIVKYKSQIYAVPKDGRSLFLDSVDGRTELAMNVVPWGLRRILLRILPNGVVSVLRRFVHSTKIRKLIIRSPSSSSGLHGKTLQDVCATIEKQQTEDPKKP